MTQGSAKRPNFIVFMTDQQRADHLGCYGNPIVQTPHIDALARRGVRFDNFYVTTPICQPNRAALATGQMNSVNGCRQNGIPISRHSTTYADVLRGAGYRTGLVGKAHFQNVSNIPAKPRVQQGAGAALVSPDDLARKDQRHGPGYQTEVRGAWAAEPDREMPLPYYGFDHVRLCIGHGDQVEGHYTAWLRDRLNGAQDPRGRDMALDRGQDKGTDTGTGTGADKGTYTGTDPARDTSSPEVDTPVTPQIWRTAVPETLYPTAYVAEEACAFLDQPQDDPFLLVVSFPDPHHPFTPPGRYYDMYDPAEIPLPESFAHPTGARQDLPDHVKRAYEIGDKAPDAYWPFHVDADTARQMIALNYGSISMIDDMVGRILGQLETLGQAEDTVICFMSDHGDYMGDHGTVLKHGVHSHGVIRVPFLWVDPQASTAPEDKAAPPDGDSRASHSTAIHGSAIDFAPTLLQRAGLKLPIGMQGRDLLAEDAADLPVLIEDPGIGVYADPDADTSIRSLVHDGWRLSVFEGSDLGELYDLRTDPHELHNLWAAPEAAARKGEMLFQMIQRQIALRDKTVLATNQA